jgi:hypothetical protein
MQGLHGVQLDQREACGQNRPERDGVRAKGLVAEGQAITSARNYSRNAHASIVAGHNTHSHTHADAHST